MFQVRGILSSYLLQTHTHGLDSVLTILSFKTL